MINSTEILEKLKKGESLDDIASSITKVLNIAQQDYLKYQEEEKVKAAERAQREELKQILMSLCAWGDKYFPKIFKDSVNVTALANTVLEGLDLIGTYNETFKDFDLDTLFCINDNSNKINFKAVKTNSSSTLEDLVRQYIKA